MPCVSTPADIFLVFRTLLNCLKCIIYEDCYSTGNGGIISQLKMQNEVKLTDESWISYQQGKGNEEYQKYMEDLTEEREEVLSIWNNLNTNEQETVMSMLH